MDLIGKASRKEISGISCLFSLTEDNKGLPLASIEIIEGTIKLNGKSYVRENDKQILIRGGDELLFDTSPYIFQQTIVTPSILASVLKELELEQDTQATLEKNLREKILLPQDIDISFENFPYDISDVTMNFLIASTRFHLDATFDGVRKSGPKLMSELQKILLSGPTDVYQEALAKAIAEHFDARLIIVDAFSLSGRTALQNETRGVIFFKSDKEKGSQWCYLRVGTKVRYEGESIPRGPTSGSTGTVFLSFGDNEFAKTGVKFDESFEDGNDLGGLCVAGNGFFCPFSSLLAAKVEDVVDDKKWIRQFFESISNISQSGPVVVFIKQIKDPVGEFFDLRDNNENLPYVVIASKNELDKTELQRNNKESTSFATLFKPRRQPDASKESPELTKQISSLFPNKLTIQLPKGQTSFYDWKLQIERQVQTTIAQRNARLNAVSILAVLKENGLKCPDLEGLDTKNEIITNESIRKIVGWAIGSCEESKLVLSLESIKYGLGIFESIQGSNKDSNDSAKIINDSAKDATTEESFERSLLANVITPSKIGTTFEDIGALESLKDTLKELVILPLQRPELFTIGQLAKPCKGILLFGPPGTGKTMLAKAVATEAGANFLNVSLSNITSKWHGESEKYIKSLFSLANKMSPCIVFLDEVDSFLGTRENTYSSEVGNHMKTEFMVHWDGFLTKEKSRVIILAATNRPFDLDEAVIRRFPRRFMVPLPDAESREKILEKILAKDKLSSDVDLKSVANRTNGYSASDLKNLCVAAAFCPIREILDKEKKDKASALAQAKPEPPLCSKADVGPIKMEHLLNALKEVRASVMPESSIMDKLNQWNESFGGAGGRSRKSGHLSYYV